MFGSLVSAATAGRLRVLAIGLVALALPGAVVGPAVIYVPLVLAILLWAALEPPTSWSTMARNWKASPVATLTAALLVLLVGSSLGGIVPAYSLAQTRMVAVVVLAGGLLAHVLGQQPKPVLMLFWKLLAAFTLAGFAFTLIVAAGEPWFLQWGLYSSDDAWTQTHLRFFSSVLAVTLPFCWVWWLKDGNTLKLQGKGLWLCALSGVIVIVSAGRAGWLGTGAAAAVLGLLMVRHHGVKLPWAKLGVTVLGSLGVGGLAYSLFYGMASVQERLGVTVTVRGVGGGRLDIWNMALAHMADQPLFGIGVNAFRFLPGADYHPHDFLLQLGLETGLFGTILALILLAWVARDMFVRSRTDMMATAALAGFVGFLVCALTNKSIFNPAWLVFLVVIIALGRQTTKLTLKDLTLTSRKK